MAKVRAYKIAEELNLEKEEFVRRAAEIGIKLRSAMTALDEVQADELRRRLGGGDKSALVDKRVAGGVIRRRRKVAPAPEPEVPAEKPVAAEPAAEPEPLEEPAEIAARAGEPEAEIREPEAAVVEPAPPVETAIELSGRQPDTSESPRVPSRRPIRRQVLDAANVREQETLARQMRGNVQSQLERRRQLVEQQSRIQSRRRRPVGAGRKPPAAAARERRKVLKLAGPISFQELSGQLGVKVSELVRRLRALGSELDRDELLDVEMAELVGTDLGVEVQRTGPDVEERVVAAAETQPEDLEPRPPVVTVMGHVDHGKTSLLDAIRQADVVSGEAGGITQHIGAYQVEADGGLITFIDTPGHSAFTQMRARGAQLTDIAVLVVAADDGVMPQTVEALDHARAAKVPVIVAINKVDKPDADPQRAKRALLERELVLEEFGGDTIGVEVSATQRTNLPKLLEMINLQAEVLELKARRRGAARGTVIEAQLERGRGPVATVLVREGTLRRGDPIVVGAAHGRVRALSDERGEALQEAGPSAPVQMVGLSAVPEAGDEVVVVKNEREAKEVAEHRVAEQRRRAGGEAPEPLAAEDLFAQLDDDDKKELLVLLKADVRGTMEAIRDALEDLSTERVKLRVIHAGVGAITESDVMLASASKALIVGFHVRPEPAARKAAEQERVEMRISDVIYEAIDDIRGAMSGLLPPKVVERVRGRVEVRQLFSISRLGTVAGCAVTEGPVRRADSIRVIRDGVPVYSGRMASLRRFKDNVSEVQAGLECGISIENYNDVKVGDALETFVLEESPDTL